MPPTIYPQDRDDTVVGVLDYSQRMRFIIEDAFPSVNTSNIQWHFTNLTGTTVDLLNSINIRRVFTDDRRQLSIDPVMLSDRGTYTLSATNEAGTRNATINFDVHG